MHRADPARGDLAPIWERAHPTRSEQYRSACQGYGTFWGNRKIEWLGGVLPAQWTHDRLTVNVHPEMEVLIDGVPTVVKLHTDAKQVLDQRLANPLIDMMRRLYPGDHETLIVDVHRGRAFVLKLTRADYDVQLRMEASSFLMGWNLVRQLNSAA